VLGREGEFKAVGPSPEKSPRLFGDVRGVIVEHQTDACARRVMRVGQSQKFDKAEVVE